MHVDTAISKRGNKIYTRHLLRNSYRENGKVKHKTLANLSDCSEQEIAAIKLALKHKHNLSQLTPVTDLRIQQGSSFGSLWVMQNIAQRLGISKALGDHFEGRLALWQIAARLIQQGSRLSCLRMADSHAVRELLGLENLTKDNLYNNLSWLAEHQETIEKKLFQQRCARKAQKPTLFLYDVTSSYLEGEHNVLAAYGYNRDGKKGKKQLVIGLLTDGEGVPVAVRIFEGNTADTQTVETQIRLLVQQFGVDEVTVVGDRGMLKMPQISTLPEGFSYITSLTTDGIRTLMKQGLIQMSLFDVKLTEVESEGVRYILRRNPVRQKDIADTRTSKLASVQKLMKERNQYLAEHPKAKTATAKRLVDDKIKTLGLTKWLSASIDDASKQIQLTQDEEALAKESQLDGCYVIKTDLKVEQACTETVHARYQDLAKVESAFRTMKQAHLEFRPVYVRTTPSTQGHVFVVMLAYMIQQELARCWGGHVQEGLDQLSALSLMTLKVGGASCLKIPQPTPTVGELLAQLQLTLPEVLPRTKPCVPTNKRKA